VTPVSIVMAQYTVTVSINFVVPGLPDAVVTLFFLWAHDS